MSASAPPLAAMITAHRNATLARAGRGDRRVVAAELAQPLEPAGVTRADHVPRKLAFLPAGEQPGQRRPDDVGAD
jgi:hypothetical protein